MAGIEAIKDLVKPPFANYDIVVYFGCGLFSLPFALHYVDNLLPISHSNTSKLSVKLARIDPSLADNFVVTLIATLTVLFCVYIFGHIIAYLGSQLVEKTMESFFGLPSTLVLRGCSEGRDDFRSMIKSQLSDGVKRQIRDKSYISSIIRIGAHAPLYIFYFPVWLFEIYGYFRTRVSNEVFELAKSKMEEDTKSAIIIHKDREWFKSLESVVANNNPIATSRLYNYLIISGLFRSLCFIFLVSSWFELTYLISALVVDDPPAGLLMFTASGIGPQIFSYSAICILYVFCLASYFKFQRRYVEEAIFAFVFTRDTSPLPKLVQTASTTTPTLDRKLTLFRRFWG